MDYANMKTYAETRREEIEYLENRLDELEQAIRKQWNCFIWWRILEEMTEIEQRLEDLY